LASSFHEKEDSLHSVCSGNGIGKEPPRLQGTQGMLPMRRHAVTTIGVVSSSFLLCYASKDTPEWEVASHGYRWWNYQHVDVEVEREHIRRSVDIHTRLLGKRPVGFYQGKPSLNTRRLVVEEGGFKYGKYLMIVPSSWKCSSRNVHLSIFCF
jgi:peptidoglycan/xylan/chitin deacetylase (PgdA/CDA1 family)